MAEMLLKNGWTQALLWGREVCIGRDAVKSCTMAVMLWAVECTGRDFVGSWTEGLWGGGVVIRQGCCRDCNIGGRWGTVQLNVGRESSIKRWQKL